MSRFISPFTDFGFKRIFGQEPHKDILIDFLNQILSMENVQIKDLTYKKTEFTGITDLDRKVIFDLYCESENGEKFIVEMQKVKQTFFKDRTLFYSTFPIQEQALKGEWNYNLKAVYCVAVMGFTFEDEDARKTVVRRVKLMDQDTCKVFYEKLTYIFIQMPEFNKNIEELETRLDQWLYVLKHLDTFERIPEHVKDKIFQKVFDIAEFSQLKEGERMVYMESLKYSWDIYSILTTAKEDGFEEGIKEGIEKGKESEKVEIAKKGIKEGLSNELISALTGLSVEQIQTLREEMQ